MKRNNVLTILLTAILVGILCASCTSLPSGSVSSSSATSDQPELFPWAKKELGTMYYSLSSLPRGSKENSVVLGKTITLKGNSLYLKESLSLWFELTHQKTGDSYETTLDLIYDYELATSINGKDYPGLTERPRYLLFSHSESSESVLVTCVSNIGLEELVDFILSCPDSGEIRVDVYSEKGYRISTKSSEFIMQGSGGYYRTNTDSDYHYTFNAVDLMELKDLVKSYLVLKAFGNHVLESDQLHGLVAYNLKKPEIYLTDKRTGLCINGDKLVLRYLCYNKNPLNIGLNNEPAYLLLSNESLEEVIVLSVDGKGYVEVGEDLYRYFCRCPKGTTIRMEYYDSYGNKLSKKSFAIDKKGVSSSKSINGYYDEMDSSKVADMIGLYLELNPSKGPERLYADGSSAFFLCGKDLWLKYENYYKTPLNYHLQEEPRYLLLRSRDTNRSMVLDVGNEGLLKADTKLLKFICSFADGDVIQIEYYNVNKNRMTFYKRTYDSNGYAVRTRDSAWSGIIDVTAARNLLRQWQSLDDYDYLGNWEIDREATCNWILGLEN